MMHVLQVSRAQEAQISLLRQVLDIDACADLPANEPQKRAVPALTPGNQKRSVRCSSRQRDLDGSELPVARKTKAGCSPQVLDGVEEGPAVRTPGTTREVCSFPA